MSAQSAKGNGGLGSDLGDQFDPSQVCQWHEQVSHCAQRADNDTARVLALVREMDANNDRRCANIMAAVAETHRILGELVCTIRKLEADLFDVRRAVGC